MTIFNTNSTPHKQHFYGLSTDQKLTSAYIGDLFHEIDTKLDYIFNGTAWVLDINIHTKLDTITNSLINAIKVIPTFTSGITTNDGLTTQLIDSTKNFEANSLNGKTIKFTVNGIEYVRVILNSISDTISFPPIQEATPASVIITGSTGGSMVINCVEPGKLGNTYSVELVAGTGLGKMTDVTFANNILTITSPTDGEGNPTDILPGNVEGIIDTTPELAALFDVGNYNAGLPLDITAEPIPFEGGLDDVIVNSGVDYVVFA